MDIAMKVELTAEELQRVILALKAQSKRQKDAGEPAIETHNLIAHLENDERDLRRQNLFAQLENDERNLRRRKA